MYYNLHAVHETEGEVFSFPLNSVFLPLCSVTPENLPDQYSTRRQKGVEVDN